MIIVKKQSTFDLLSIPLYCTTANDITIEHCYTLTKLFSRRAQYLLFFLIGTPSVYDSLYKLALLKQLMEKNTRKLNTTKLSDYDVVHTGVASVLTHTKTPTVYYDKLSLIGIFCPKCLVSLYKGRKNRLCFTCSTIYSPSHGNKQIMPEITPITCENVMQ